ncbi:MAG: tRNA (adenosine(37)-N6)-threonylcarbamoyltransferase complex ATPase subunit type 1 TsaE [Treponema sp.]|jgi:tRNA threonylcarbamoyladenosine biosynthesis protein TsaE|nr:tRNA (adenosine(37)-N6)-threonylcarbamoyltransferase complex ATPase subunit type 1 TsaE [Treponema sp.]
MIEIISNSPGETTALGKQIAVYLCAGSVLALEGTLGSGKTCLTKGIALGLGIEETITSPTYTIINEYTREDASKFYHIDAYRLETDKDFEDIGGAEIISCGGISVIEWSERLSSSLPENVITVSLNITGADSRLIKINGIEKL